MISILSYLMEVMTMGLGTETIEERSFEYCGYDVTVRVYKDHDVFDGEERIVSCKASKINGDNSIRHSTKRVEKPGAFIVIVGGLLGFRTPKDLEKQIEKTVEEMKEKIENEIDKNINEKAAAESALDRIEEELDAT